MKKILFILLGLLNTVAMLADKFAKQGEKTIAGITYEYGIVTHDDNSTTYEATLIDGTGVAIPKVDFIESSINKVISSISLLTIWLAVTKTGKNLLL